MNQKKRDQIIKYATWLATSPERGEDPICYIAPEYASLQILATDLLEAYNPKELGHEDEELFIFIQGIRVFCLGSASVLSQNLDWEDFV